MRLARCMRNHIRIGRIEPGKLIGQVAINNPALLYSHPERGARARMEAIQKRVAALRGLPLCMRIQIVRLLPDTEMV